MTLLEIPEIKKIYQIAPTSILRVEAHSSYSKIYFVDQPGTMLVSKVLAWVQQRLPAEMFIRVHRSHLVNSMYVTGVSGLRRQQVELMNGEVLSVSRRKNEAFRKTCLFRESIPDSHSHYHSLNTHITKTTHN